MKKRLYCRSVTPHLTMDEAKRKFLKGEWDECQIVDWLAHGGFTRVQTLHLVYIWILMKSRTEIDNL